MNVGEKVIVKRKLVKARISVGGNNHIVEWREGWPTDMAGIYLGKVTVYEGRTHSDMDDDGYVNGRYFQPSKHLSVAVVQPLSAGNRYRRPVYARIEDVMLVTGDTQK